MSVKLGQCVSAWKKARLEKEGKVVAVKDMPPLVDLNDLDDLFNNDDENVENPVVVEQGPEEMANRGKGFVRMTEKQDYTQGQCDERWPGQPRPG